MFHVVAATIAKGTGLQDWRAVLAFKNDHERHQAVCGGSEKSSVKCLPFILPYQWQCPRHFHCHLQMSHTYNNNKKIMSYKKKKERGEELPGTTINGREDKGLNDRWHARRFPGGKGESC